MRNYLSETNFKRALCLGSLMTLMATPRIATIGVDDLDIVHSPDATLICKKRDATGIKELVDNVRTKFGEQYL